MFRSLLAAAAALSLSLAGAARADVLYTFVETDVGGAWASHYQGSPVSLSFELTDAAVAKGAFSMTQQQNSFWQSGDSGLEWLAAAGPNLSVGLGPGNSVFSMALTFGPNGQVKSSRFHLDEVWDTDYVDFSGNGSAVSGAYFTDSYAIPGCYQAQGSCTVSGHWKKREVPVPEPSSLALLGAGLFGFLGVRRRRA